MITETGSMIYENEVVIPNIKRKQAAENALAAIKETLQEDVSMSYGIAKDILYLADKIAYYKPWS